MCRNSLLPRLPFPCLPLKVELVASAMWNAALPIMGRIHAAAVTPLLDSAAMALAEVDSNLYGLRVVSLIKEESSEFRSTIFASLHWQRLHLECARSFFADDAVSASTKHVQVHLM